MSAGHRGPQKVYYQSETTARDGANQVVANTRAHFSRPSCSITIVFSCAIRQIIMPKTALAMMSAKEYPTCSNAVAFEPPSPMPLSMYLATRSTQLAYGPHVCHYRKTPLRAYQGFAREADTNGYVSHEIAVT